MSVEWVRQKASFNNSSIGGVDGVVVRYDASGSIFFSAYAYTGNFGSNAAPSGSYYIGKLDSNGNTLWTVPSGGSFSLTSTDYPFIAPDNTGGVYTAFEYTNPPYPGQSAVGIKDIVVQHYSLNGALIWTSETTINGAPTMIGGTGSNIIPSITVGQDGNIYGTHITNGQIQGGIFTGDANTDFAIVLWSMDSNGNKNWAYQLSTFSVSGSNIVSGIVTDPQNNIYICGNKDTPNHVFVAKYDSSGTQIWQTTSSNINTGQSFVFGQIASAIDGLSNIYIGFYTTSNVPTTSNVGNFDIVVSQLDNNGIFQWANQFPTMNTVNEDSYPSLVGLPLGGVVVANKYVYNFPLSKANMSYIDTTGNIIQTTFSSNFNSFNSFPVAYGQMNALSIHENSIVLLQQVNNGSALPGQTSISGNRDIGFVKFLFDGTPDPPFFEIRPRCSNASITYYFRSDENGKTASSFRLVLNGPSPVVSTILPPTWGYTVTGLTDGAYYSSFVTGINEYGDGKPSYFRVVQPNGFPDPPINLSYSVFDTNNVFFEWQPPVAPQTAKIGWYVITDSQTSTRYNTTADVSSITMYGLAAGTRDFYIQSVNDPGYSTKATITITI